MTAPADSALLRPDKAALRAGALARRDAMGAAARAIGSLAIAGRVAPMVARLRPAVVAGYFPIRSEADPRPILELAHELDADLALPALGPDGTMLFRRWRPGDGLSRAALGFLQPAEDRPAVIPDVILVPLAAFDRAGNRIGYGKGHYDRAIAAARSAGRSPVLIGLAFACQEVPAIPVEPHDAALGRVVTEAEILGAGDED